MHGTYFNLVKPIFVLGVPRNKTFILVEEVDLKIHICLTSRVDGRVISYKLRSSYHPFLSECLSSGCTDVKYEVP
jgi:hypothetical protein